MQKIKINDEVIIRSGKEKGKIGKIKNINDKTNMILVEGINLKTKSIKPTQENTKGGLSQVERPLHRSKVALICSKTKKASRTGIKVANNGAKSRFTKKSGETVK